MLDAPSVPLCWALAHELVLLDELAAKLEAQRMQLLVLSGKVNWFQLVIEFACADGTEVEGVAGALLSMIDSLHEAHVICAMLQAKHVAYLVRSSLKKRES